MQHVAAAIPQPPAEFVQFHGPVFCQSSNMSVEEERTLAGTQIILHFSVFSPAALDHLEPVCCIGWKTEAHLKCSELLGVICRILPAKLL